MFLPTRARRRSPYALLVLIVILVVLSVGSAWMSPATAQSSGFTLAALFSQAGMGILMLVLFLFFLMLGFPIAFTLMALGVMFGYYGMGSNIFNLFVQRTYSVMANDVLLSIPLFLFMGYVVERANILDRLFRSIQLAAGWLPGSLAVATLATCALFATATGIVGAVVTLMGLLAFPAMLRAGYDVRLASGVVCAGGCLGILIPPSVMLILYGATAGVSVVKLYAAAFIPGVMLATLYMVYVIVLSIVKPSVAPKLPPEERNVPMVKVLWELATSFFPLFILILGVLGAIMFGFATPQEAAAVGAIGSLILAVLYNADYSKAHNRAALGLFIAGLFAFVAWCIGVRFAGIPFHYIPVILFLGVAALVCLVLSPGNGFAFEKLKESTFLTGRASAMVCWLFVGSAVFSAVFAYLGGQKVVEDFVLSLNLQTSFLSPPVAMAPFYLKGVAPKHVTIDEIFQGVYPFLAIVIFMMVLFYAFPQIGLWLPEYLYGKSSR